MPEKEKKMADAEKAFAEMKPAIDAALSAIAAPQRMLQFWQAAMENKGVITLREEVSGLKEKVENLKAEIPALESEIKMISEAKAAFDGPVRAVVCGETFEVTRTR